MVEEGDSIVLAPYVPVLLRGTWQWPDGSDAKTFTIASIANSQEYPVSYIRTDTTYTFIYRLFVSEGARAYRTPAVGEYLIRHRYTDTYLTSPREKDGVAYLAPLVANADITQIADGQVWLLEEKNQRYNFISLPDSLYLNKEGLMKSTTLRPFRFKGAKGTDYLSIQNNGTSGNICWAVDADGIINYAASEEPTDSPFELVSYSEGMGLHPSFPDAMPVATSYYSLGATRIDAPQHGIVLCRRIWSDGSVTEDKIFLGE